MIQAVIDTYGLLGQVSYLCHLTGVSRSGYYAWRHNEPRKQRQHDHDAREAERIRELFEHHHEKAGALQIKMMLENDQGIIMNHKKIRRLMAKFQMITKIRRRNPYKQLQQATQEHQTCPNLLNRDFDVREPGKILLTDITYLYDGEGQKAYLSCIKDSATKEILAYVVSTSLAMALAHETLDQLQHQPLHPEVMLHSDQGTHYTHPAFQARVKQAGLRQSMSRRGNCWDNAPMESFFGHFKDMVEPRLCATFDQLKRIVYDYIDRYNHRRYQWGLKKMTPVQYRDHLLIA